MKYSGVLVASVMLASSARTTAACVVDASSGYIRIALPATNDALEEHDERAFVLPTLATSALDRARFTASAPATTPRQLVAAKLAAGEHAGKAASPGDVIGKGQHSTKRALRRFARKLKRMTRDEAPDDPRHAPDAP